MYKLLTPLIAMVIAVGMLVTACQKETIETSYARQLKFSETEITECQLCATTDTGYYRSTGPFCKSHYDYVKYFNNPLEPQLQAELNPTPFGVVDGVVTLHDYNFMKSLYDDDTQPPMYQKDLPVGVLDVIPAFNTFVNEVCATSHDNLSAVRVDGTLVYMEDMHDYLPDVNGLYRNRFQTWFFVRDINGGTNEFELIGNVGFEMLPLAQYGAYGDVCEGVQEVGIKIIDVLTGAVYVNVMNTNAGYGCDVLLPCQFGLDIFDVQFTDYNAEYWYAEDPYPDL